MADKPLLPQRDPGNNGPVVGGVNMPVPHAEPVLEPKPELPEPPPAGK